MSSINRAVRGDVLVFDLETERHEAVAAIGPAGRIARTLLKQDGLRVTEVVLAPGAEVTEHQADGAITVQPVAGRIRFTAAGDVYDLGPGQLLSLAPGVRHAVASEGGATFLLTVAPAKGTAADSSPGNLASPGAGSGGARLVPEAWLRGPVEGVPPLLMPVAHALIQAGEDLRRAAEGLTVAALWLRPGGAASVAFHLRHVAGSLDRLFTYARGEALSPVQRAAITREGMADAPAATAGELLERTDAAIARAVALLRTTPEGTLLEHRVVGRSQLPSNVLGLLFHAAEHTQRHTGQVITTVRIVCGANLEASGDSSFPSKGGTQ